MFRNGAWGLAGGGGSLCFCLGGGDQSWEGGCSQCRSTSCSLIINSSYSHPFEEGCLERGSAPASLLEDAFWGGGERLPGGRFLAFLEHCRLLMNENLMQPVRGPIVADLG